MQTAFGSKISRVVDQAALKGISKQIFERTFAVTGALNTLTLLVSGVALFASLLTLSGVRLAQVAPVWALGVTRRRLGNLEVGKLLLLAAVTAVLAIPLGLVLALVPRSHRQCAGVRLAAAVRCVSGAVGADFRDGAAHGFCCGDHSGRAARAHCAARPAQSVCQ